MFVGNVSEDGFENNPLLDRLKEYAPQNAPVVAICAKIEAEMAEMDDEDRRIPQSWARTSRPEPPDPRRLQAAGPADLLHRRRQGSARLDHPRRRHRAQAAGVIHGDFERGFIRAQTIAFDDFIQYKGEQGAKDAGKMRAEGKEYVVKDGDVMNFLFNV
jgi:ribosome-binding ATPase YchF (GTP1/OBG family)